MDTTRLIRQGPCEWEITPFGAMRVPAVIYATEALLQDMDEKVYEQVTNVATLPGIVKACSENSLLKRPLLPLRS